MPRYNFVQLDVFTDQAFGGNPLAVFPEAEGLTDQEMQTIAREMNLSETVFVLRPSNASPALRRLRIFTPARELPFAGHPVVGAWNWLARSGIVPLPENGSGRTGIKQEIGIGVLPVEVEFEDSQPTSVVMTQGRFDIKGHVEDNSQRAAIADSLGLAVADLAQHLPIQVISTGLPVLVVGLHSLAALERCRIRASLAAAYTGVGAMGCYAFTRETISDGLAQAHARMFVPSDGIAEDPATGSAAGALAAYLVHHGSISVQPRTGTARFVVEQGDFMQRPSRISVEVAGARNGVTQVRVGGSSVVVAHGELIF